MELANFAVKHENSRGRLFNENDDILRNPFERDRSRIIHSAAFRRLEYKTQVFVNYEGDHYRNRLTHTIEVSQIAKGIARRLNLHEDLTESVALAHDLGHTPFGHAGEDILNEMMKNYGGFDHNANTLKIITKLEERYANFNGINLSWETLEGIAKHNGPVKSENYIKEFSQIFNLELETYPSLEAQIAAFSDDIAYHNHDLEDGLRAELFQIDDIINLPLIGENFKKVYNLYPNSQKQRYIHEAIRRSINFMINDLVNNTRENISKLNIKSLNDIKSHNNFVAGFSSEINEANKIIKEFLFKNMYRNWYVNRMSQKAKKIIRDLFEFFLESPNCLPANWQEKIISKDKLHIAQIICDYISGMTDRYAIREYNNLFENNNF